MTLGKDHPAIAVWVVGIDDAPAPMSDLVKTNRCLTTQVSLSWEEWYEKQTY
jgi:hypothetical protein